MRSKLPVFIFAAIGLLVVVAIFLVWQKSQVKPSDSGTSAPEVTIKKVDLASQPEWVQKLQVSAKKGVSANSLPNVTISVKGFPTGLVTSLNYVLQYQTSNKGTQGALSSKPVDISGATIWTKTIDLGTCSTKSCVRHEGVTSLDVELDFTTSAGDQPIWTGALSL